MKLKDIIILIGQIFTLLLIIYLLKVSLKTSFTPKEGFKEGSGGTEETSSDDDSISSVDGDDMEDTVNNSVKPENGLRLLEGFRGHREGMKAGFECTKYEDAVGDDDLEDYLKDICDLGEDADASKTYDCLSRDCVLRGHKKVCDLDKYRKDRWEEIKKATDKTEKIRILKELIRYISREEKRNLSDFNTCIGFGNQESSGGDSKGSSGGDTKEIGSSITNMFGD